MSQLESACEKQADGHAAWRSDMSAAFADLLALLKDEHLMSAYELHSSGLVQTLFNCLNNNDEPSSKRSRKQTLERINLFRQNFQDPCDEL